MVKTYFKDGSIIESNSYDFQPGVVLLYFNDAETTLTEKILIYPIAEITRIEIGC
jgi:hypothetical protein